MSNAWKRFCLLVCLMSPAFITLGCPDAVVCTAGTCVGYYYDSLVSGLDYESRTDGVVTHEGVTGENDDPGRFSHAERGMVSFSIGGVSLGESVAKARVTPFDLADIPEEAIGGCDASGELPDDSSAFRRVANLAVLLQTLDADGDDTNGIDIRPEVAALFDGLSLQVDQTSAGFEANTALLGVLAEANAEGLFSGDRALRPRRDALRALYRGIGLCP